MIRINITSTGENMDVETYWLSWFTKRGGHVNVIAFFDHGVLRPFPCYFIDMELCDFSLSDYLYEHNDSIQGFEEDPECWPALVPGGSSVFKRMQNLCRVGGDIACGLEFLHSLYVIHRDIKPANGNLYLVKVANFCSLFS